MQGKGEAKEEEKDIARGWEIPVKGRGRRKNKTWKDKVLKYEMAIFK
jgi:hypothetical protein